MANLQQEYPLVLLGILEELANMRHWLSFQDLCRMVSTRFDLEHLVELRSLLFAAASRDPCFPATLFRDRVTTRGLGLSPIGVAADIVTIFSLIQMTGGAPEDQPASHPMRAQTVLPVDKSPGLSLPGVDQLSFAGRERARAHSDSGGRPIDQHLLFPKLNYSGRKRGSLPPDPISLVSAPPARARAVSFDWPHNTPLFPGGQVPSETMQNIYLPLETDSESSADSATMEVFEAEHGSSVGQKRNVFKKDFHNQPLLIPQVTMSNESPSPGKGQKSFDSRSFELLTNPYPSPTAAHHSPPEQRAKHESLDDLQDSTYFGPGSIQEWSLHHLQPPRIQKSIWSNKSHSLEDKIGLGSMGMGMESTGGHLPRRSSPAISHPVGSPVGESGGNGVLGGGDGMRAMGTQTDPPDPRRLRSLVHADRFSFMTSLEDPEFGEDDISAIFRFLDEVSMCGSTGVLHPNEGAAAINQDTPEARRGRLGQLQRLFHSLESSDDGLKASVCKLLLRMSQIERQLESLKEVKAEISQVLSALQRLDEKIPQPICDNVVGGGGGTGDRWLEPLSAGASSFSSHPITPVSESSDPQPLSVSGHLLPAISTSSLEWNRWNTGGGQQTDVSKAQGDLKVVKEGKKDVTSRRASKIKAEERGGLDSNPLSVSDSARGWAVSFSKSKSSKASPGKMGQMDQSNSTTNLLSSQKPPNLVEQVFNSALFRQKESSLTGGMASGKIIDPRMAEGRVRPVWTVNERESRISPLDLHAQESLNPNNLEFWMEDMYTPGYDALLRRKEADLRRVKACKLAALIIVAIIIILVIVIPICTLGS